jgi:SAM-dependent methyltransferase
MEATGGLRALLETPLVYRAAMWLLRNEAMTQWFVSDVLALQPGQKIIDLGCGTGDNLPERFPSVEYIGLDIRGAYIEAAQKRHPERGTFIAGNADEWARDPRTKNADVVLAYGVLHHVDDAEALRLLSFAKSALKPSGRFVWYEPCLLAWQGRWSRWTMGLDRGQGIHTERAWRGLIAQVFPNPETEIVTGVNRLGYVGIIGQCQIKR